MDLNCKNLASATESVLAILELSSEELHEFLDAFEYDFTYPSEPPEDQVLNSIRRTLKLKPKVEHIDRIFWFHGTRAMAGEQFRDGLLPVGARIDHIWDQLFMLIGRTFRRSEWDDFREKLGTGGFGHHGCLYRLKVRRPEFQGPYAFLVREALLLGEKAGQRAFLRYAPEIIEDISWSFQEIYPEIDLAATYLRTTLPCVVNFFVDDCPDWVKQGALRAAVNYVHHHRKGFGQSGMPNTNFDGEGQVIRREQIVSIQHLRDGLDC